MCTVQVQTLFLYIFLVLLLYLFFFITPDFHSIHHNTFHHCVEHHHSSLIISSKLSFSDALNLCYCYYGICPFAYVSYMRYIFIVFLECVSQVLKVSHFSISFSSHFHCAFLLLLLPFFYTSIFDLSAFNSSSLFLKNCLRYFNIFFISSSVSAITAKSSAYVSVSLLSFYYCLSLLSFLQIIINF